MPAESEPQQAGQRAPSWTRVELKRPAVALAAAVALAVSVASSLVAGCNVHEIGHVIVATPLGWEVDRVNYCLPSGGGVQYASVGTWAGNAQGYAGGLTAAVVLAVVYAFVFLIPRTPLRSPVWWAAGVGPVIWVGPQVVIALFEGGAGPGEDYTETMNQGLALFVPLFLGSVGAGLVVHVWLWRGVWRKPVPG